MKKKVFNLILMVLLLLPLNNLTINAEEETCVTIFGQGCLVEKEYLEGFAQSKDADIVTTLPEKEIPILEYEVSKGSEITPFNYTWVSKLLPFSVSSHGQKQISIFHCGPASARAVLKYLTGRDIAQSTIAPKVGFDGGGTPWSGMGPGINSFASLDYGYSNINTSGRGFRSVVRNSIGNGRPVIAYTGLPELNYDYYGPSGMNWNTAHYVVMIGYQFRYAGTIALNGVLSDSTVSPYNNSVSRETVTYYDPYTNQIRTCSLSEFINSMRACSSPNQVLIW